MALPAFWCTTLAKVLSGDQPCPLQPWLSGRMKFAQQRSAALARWQTEHTEFLDQTIAKWEAEGWRCAKEQFFKVEGATAALSGKADFIAKKDGCRPLIVDVKTGDPRDSDVTQVMIEIIMVPLSWGKKMTFDGQVIYRDHVVPVPHAEAESLAPRIFSTLKRMGTEERPEPKPSQSACKWCAVPDSECSQRWQEQPVTKTELF